MAMLKLLLIGFTEQNANVIQMFVELTFENVKVSRIPRLPENTPPKMPELTVLETESDIFVIDAESIGFDFGKHEVCCEQVNQVIPNKAILLISRQSVPEGQIRVPDNFQWLNVPYTRSQMAEKLQSLISDVQLKRTTHHHETTTGGQLDGATDAIANDLNHQPPSVANPSATQQIEKIGQSENHSNPAVPKTNPADDIATSNALFEILRNTFKGLGDTPFFEFAKTLYELKDYTVFHVNGHHLYINPFDKSVVVSRVERIIDHFMIGQNLRQCLSTRETLDASSFEQQTKRHLASGDKKLMVSKLIWYIGIDMIPRNAFDDNHQLLIETRFMPNLAGINFVPNYVMPLIASCIGRERNLSEFHQLFPQLTNAQVNQVIILLVMSHVINSDTLLNQAKPNSMTTNRPVASAPSATTATTPQAGVTSRTTAATTDNTGIKKAQQTGFLKRLLGKLGVSV